MREGIQKALNAINLAQDSATDEQYTKLEEARYILQDLLEECE